MEGGGRGRRKEDEAVRQLGKQIDKQSSKQRATRAVDQSVNQSFINQPVHRSINPTGPDPPLTAVFLVSERDGLNGEVEGGEEVTWGKKATDQTFEMRSSPQLLHFSPLIPAHEPPIGGIWVV